MPEPESVELHEAFMWDCPSCGRENFVRAIRVYREDLTTNDIEDLLEEFELADVSELDELFEQDMILTMAPSQVTCKDCANTFPADSGEDDE